MTKTMVVEWVWNGEYLAECKFCGENNKVDDDGYCEHCIEVGE